MVGAGTRGSGIAQFAAQAGCQVVLVDASEDALARSQNNLDKIFSRLVEKGKLTEAESDQIKGRIQRTTSMDALASAELVIEAIVEDLDIKTDLFQRLEQIVGKDTVLATNTSSLSVTALAKGCQRPEQVIGLHFFNPAPVMALVEVIPALQTQSGLVDQAMSTMAAWGKSPALATDTPGFIVNRVARPFYSEALRILEEGIASAEDIDASMRAKGFRMGPFELMDLIGHDVNYKVTSTVHEAFLGTPIQTQPHPTPACRCALVGEKNGTRLLHLRRVAKCQAIRCRERGRFRTDFSHVDERSSRRGFLAGRFR